MQSLCDLIYLHQGVAFQTSFHPLSISCTIITDVRIYCIEHLINLVRTISALDFHTQRIP